MEEFLPIKSFRVKNFKGIRDSGEVRFTPLTVFIGNNGSGKSSLIEALQTYQDIVVNGLDKAMNRWRGFENIHNPPISLIGGNGKKPKKEAIEFILQGEKREGAFYRNLMLIELSENNLLKISQEKIEFDVEDNLRKSKPFTFNFLDRDNNGKTTIYRKNLGITIIDGGLSLLNLKTADGLILHIILAENSEQYLFDRADFIQLVRRIYDWQFATLNPANMIHPLPLQRTGGDIKLNPDGSNIAEYLMDIRKQSQEAYDGIIESLTYVLPYLKDMQPNLTTELERTVYLRMHEGNYTIPQWLLSTGTMRILCLLALFRHPTPPPVIFIEEIENGLDPRTIHFIVEEIRSLIVLGKSQVVITTHSPYLLDLLDLSQIVVVERDNGETKFSRPADDESLRAWAKKFSPGQLYTMNQLTHQEG